MDAKIIGDSSKDVKDPPNCCCTDCATGYSKPINRCTEEELEQLRCGRLRNASVMRVTGKISDAKIEPDHRLINTFISMYKQLGPPPRGFYDLADGGRIHCKQVIPEHMWPLSERINHILAARKRA